MAYVYLATDDENIPVCVTESLQKLEELLFEYYGLPNATNVEYLGFIQFDNCGYPNAYEGSYKFKVKYDFEEDAVIEKIHRHFLILNELR